MGVAVLMKKGVCLCHTAPMGEHGLEGFVRDDVYEYQYMKTDKLNKDFSLTKGGFYYRVFPTAGEEYYEVAGPVVFKRYFKELTGGEECT